MTKNINPWRVAIVVSALVVLVIVTQAFRKTDSTPAVAIVAQDDPMKRVDELVEKYKRKHSGPCRVSEAQLKRIRIGQTFGFVEDQTGCRGKLINETRLDFTYRTYVFYGEEEGTGAVVTVRGFRVDSVSWL